MENTLSKKRKLKELEREVKVKQMEHKRMKMECFKLQARRKSLEQERELQEFKCGSTSR
jgi:hypothetical protein